MLQSLPIPLLELRRKTAEAGIILQGAFLLRGRQIFISPQPVASVSRDSRTRLYLGLRLPRWLLMLLRRCRGCMSLLSPMESASVRQTGKRDRERDSQTGGRQPIRSVFSPPHFPRLCSLHFPGLQFPFNNARIFYGFAATSCCKSRSSSNSKSEYIS